MEKAHKEVLARRYESAVFIMVELLESSANGAMGQGGCRPCGGR